MKLEATYTVFAGFTHIASGDLKSVLTRAREYLDRESPEPLLFFDDRKGTPVDFDLRGSLDEVLRNAEPPEPKRGPGRPKLGVVCGEVCLLPRHWEWLERQSRSASATLRRLVESARKNESGRDRLKQAVQAAGRFMWFIAGDLEGFEEASRALYAGRWQELESRIGAWPRDVKSHLQEMLGPARDAEQPGRSDDTADPGAGKEGL
jgi:hypothetical protein